MPTTGTRPPALRAHAWLGAIAWHAAYHRVGGRVRHLDDGGTATTSEPRNRARAAGTRFRPSFPLVEAKLHPSVDRPGLVHRARLMARRPLEDRAAVVTVIAPAGYGKTTFLAEAVRRDERSAAWLSLDDYDNDPSVFLTYVAAALDRLEPIDPSLTSALAVQGSGVLGAAVPRLASELHRWTRPGLLVLDDVHRLVNRSCLDALAALLEHLPPGFQVVLAGRVTPGLPLARMRVQGMLQEITREDLAFDPAETRELAAAMGRSLSRDQARDLTDRTEGWPAAIYLALLPGPHGTVDALAFHISDNDGYITDYISSELQPMIDEGELTLLMRLAVLETVELSAAAAVSGLPEAPDRLRVVARTNGLVARIDAPDETYRFHPLLRGFLRAELDRRDPDAGPAVHRRAARWLAERGRLEEAVEHAVAGGDLDQVSTLIERTFLTTYYGGHADRLSRWLGRFRDGDFEERPSLAIVGAWIEALGGRPESADRLADIVERASVREPTAHGAASFESSRAMLRVVMARGGPDAILRDAMVATRLEGPASPWRATALWLLAGAHIVLGDRAAADSALAEAVTAAPLVGTPGFYALALRASLAIGRGDWRAAEQFARESQAGFERAGLGGVVSVLMAHAVAARVSIHRGDLARGRQELVRAQLMRPQATYALGWASILAQLEMARAYLSLSDPAGARSVVADAETILRHRPEMGVLSEEVRHLRAQLGAAEHAASGPSTLTPAELRILPFLSTHLTFEEIGDRIFVSRHTVKSHSVSIYAKLGVSDRAEAVERAVDIGLLEPYFGYRSRDPAELVIGTD